MTATAVVAERSPRARVGWGDLIGVTARQHRLMLVGTGVLVLAAIAGMLWVSVEVAGQGDARIGLPGVRQVSDVGELLLAGVLGFSGLVAVFWAAPLLSKEYEQRTHLLVWSQDVSPLRWLAVKTTVLAAVAVAFSVALGVTAEFMMHRILEMPSQYPAFNLFRSPYFDDVALTQAAYALFGFALGLAVSAICRRTVVSMGVTAALFVGVRAGIERFVRPYFQSPVRQTSPLGVEGPATNELPPNTLTVDSGYLDGAGTTMDYPRSCSGSYRSAGEYYSCLRQNGIVAHYRDTQPPERLGFFQLAEFGLFVVLAAVLLVVALRVVRRMARV
ncbi:hypothetical protein [Amycolatopsis sp. CA-230715]|uniref:hypothetical protein n=1 Tax=Amycolatopsis sp. CA-230715 TaxID=2745196 RepID=UPI001C026201|nr:hypothetical protein [Amycolatopsis sp. CA-230715]QWF76704.1 hypothetical protein HUW46_00080 [Amycolatopsis sp. CA-230715]